MFNLIMIGLIGQQLPNVGGWFWGIYAASWVVWVLKLIVEIIIAGLQIKLTKFDLK